jgi:TetR/AcrR family transcriptional regulator, regulator of autoinduction and epiphytic fitness
LSEAAFSAEPEAATKVARKGHTSARIARKKDQRREAILRAGSEVFAEMGYHRASLEEIADRIDLTRAALYHYFPSKDALLSECLDSGTEQAIARLSEVFDATSELDADFRLAALVRTQLTFITSDSREISRLFLNQMDWPETFRSRVKTMRDRHDMFFRKVITDGIASGEFNCIDVEVAHHCLHGSMNYAAVWLRPQSKSLTRSINALVDSLLLLFHAPA